MILSKRTENNAGMYRSFFKNAVYTFLGVCIKDFLNCQISQELMLAKGDVPVANICSICCYIFLFRDSIRCAESKMKRTQQFSSPGGEIQPKRPSDIDWNKFFIC